MEKVSTKELRDFLLKHLKEERKISPGSINYYNSIIRFIYDVVLDKPINQKQIPMIKGKRRLPKILSEEELNVFFNNFRVIPQLCWGLGKLIVLHRVTKDPLKHDIIFKV